MVKLIVYCLSPCRRNEQNVNIYDKFDWKLNKTVECNRVKT